MSRGPSLANKCLLVFGLAVVLIIGAAMVIPWMRLGSIVERSQIETSRHLARLWLRTGLASTEEAGQGAVGADAGLTDADFRALQVSSAPFSVWSEGELDDFGRAARRRFEKALAAGRSSGEYWRSTWEQGALTYRYAMLTAETQSSEPRVVLVERRSQSAASLIRTNRLYLAIAGLVAGGLAMLVFHLLTTRIILGPVRRLRDTAAKVREGNLSVRSEIRTGDEFEQLADTFNSMLTNLGEQQQQLRAINRSLDLQLTKLAERNTELYEAAREKGEFLARISHELRTPLNSIIGFAELLKDVADRDVQAGLYEPEVLAKRMRYLDNIVTAGRSLLEMINELLMMAKIDAGTMRLSVSTMNVAETCEGLLALIRPLADRKSIELVLQLHGPGGALVGDALSADLPKIDTDPQKFQQVVFNFLSNAVKFTPRGGRVTLRGERMIGGDGEARIRVSVLDTGPGIPADQRARIFERFTQLDGSHTREHQGTGLGLSIAREFSAMLGGEIQLVSEEGRGSMFSLIVPMRLVEGSPKPVAALTA